MFPKNEKTATLYSYKLNGVVFHDGNTQLDGHYTSLCYCECDKKWRYFDDYSVRVVCEDTGAMADHMNFIYDQFTKSNRRKVPYLLFYVLNDKRTPRIDIQNIDSDNTDSSLSSSGSVEEANPMVLSPIQNQNDDVEYIDGQKSDDDMEINENSTQCKYIYYINS